MRNHWDTPEAKAVRARRQAMRRGQAIDVLAERARKIAFWRECAKTNSAYHPHNGAWWHVFTWNLAFRHLLLPTLRARQDARDRAHRERFAAELREHGRKWEQTKAERKAAKARAKLPQLDLLDSVEGSK
ncbi:MAG: hypothetical protein K2X12_02835 [Burkholderiaceae bacterium]|nr:hypothetical protein [Burkholderiaceae bacterium]